MRLKMSRGGRRGGGFRQHLPVRTRRRNDTEYLLSSPENARRLLRALADSRAGRVREFTIEELYARYGLDPQG